VCRWAQGIHRKIPQNCTFACINGRIRRMISGMSETRLAVGEDCLHSGVTESGWWNNQSMSRWACHPCISRYHLVGHALRSWDSGSSALLHVTDYSQRNIRRCVGEHRFPSIVLYTEKESFIRDNTINWLNNHIQAEETPHATVELGRQRRMSVSSWEGTVRDYS